ncbi:MAG TPA: hypothetical protein DIW30_03095 [Bacteroidales bacterium]|nr:hypothetical protein [Bacteroidales bacterium]
MKQYLYLFLLFCTISVNGQNHYCIQHGHNVSVTILDSLNSQKSTSSPTAIMAGDVYDDSGTIILIRKGTPVLMQMQCRRASLTGGVGKIILTPISTQAVNGREITFSAEPIEFEGNDNAFFRSQKDVTIVAGTSFIATIANNYCFNMQPQATNGI